MSDLYTRAVAKVLRIPESEVTAYQRERAKQLCFAVVYGSKIIPGNITTDDPTEPPPDEDGVFNQVCEILYFMWDKEKR